MECWGEGGARAVAEGGEDRNWPPSPAVVDTSSYVSCSSSLQGNIILCRRQYSVTHVHWWVDMDMPRAHKNYHASARGGRACNFLKS